MCVQRIDTENKYRPVLLTCSTAWLRVELLRTCGAVSGRSSVLREQRCFPACRPVSESSSGLLWWEGRLPPRGGAPAPPHSCGVCRGCSFRWVCLPACHRPVRQDRCASGPLCRWCPAWMLAPGACAACFASFLFQQDLPLALCLELQPRVPLIMPSAHFQL